MKRALALMLMVSGCGGSGRRWPSIPDGARAEAKQFSVVVPAGWQIEDGGSDDEIVLKQSAAGGASMRLEMHDRAGRNYRNPKPSECETFGRFLASLQGEKLESTRVVDTRHGRLCWVGLEYDGRHHFQFSINVDSRRGLAMSCTYDPRDRNAHGACYSVVDAVIIGEAPKRTGTAVAGAGVWGRLAVGDHGACALDDEGHLRCWGQQSWADPPVFTPEAPRFVSNPVGAISRGPEGGVCTRSGKGIRCTVGFVDGTESEEIRREEILAVAESSRHTCIVEKSGAVSCWGDNEHGELGNGTRVRSKRRVTVARLGDATRIAAAVGRTCAVRAGGEVLCWGLGVTTPTPVAGIHDAIGIAISPDFGCILRRGRTVSCWGQNTFGQLGSQAGASQQPIAVPGLTNVAELGTGFSHACARLDDGEVRCWGDNERGQLGARVGRGVLAPTLIPGITGARRVTMGNAFQCALIGSGEVTCWGREGYDELARATPDGDKDIRQDPQVIDGDIRDAVEIVAGDRNACLRRSSGDVLCWGASGAAPHAIAGATAAAHLASSGGDMMGVLEANGTPVSWDHQLQPKRPAITGATQMAIDLGTACAVHGGAVSCWYETEKNPVGERVEGVTDAVEVAVAYEPCARNSAGKVSCWSRTGAGKARVTEMKWLTDAVQLAGSRELMCARRAGGQVVCWSKGASQKIAVEGAIDLAVSMGCGCAVLKSGEVRCWGNNDDQAFAPARSATPVRVPN